MNGRTDVESGQVIRGARWRFGDCLFDGRSLQLTVRGQLVGIERKPLELLMYLLRHPGEVVTKDELHEALWPGRVLSESVLTKSVGKLRQGLGDEQQLLIRTVHGYGYRLVAAVTVERDAEISPAPLLELKAGDSPPLRPHWQLREHLGGGGAGEVWLGEHDKTRERRVFKFGRDAASLTGLKREITLYRLLHDTLGERRDLVRLLDWNLEEPPYFVEAEYARNGSLIAWAESRGGLAAVPLSERLELAAQTAEALAAAHSAGVLHKDLKPANILVESDEGGAAYVKLGDFGSGRLLDLARLEQMEITRLGFTQTVAAGDSTSGTPLYLAPELLAGQQPTVQSDVYALGVVLYQLIVGDFRKPLAPGWEQDVENELLREDIALAAAGKPAQRLADAGQLAERLRRLDLRQLERAEQRLREHEALRLKTSLERARARRGLLQALAVVLVLGLALSAALAVRASRARDQAEAAARHAASEAAISSAVNQFLVRDLLAQADPFASGRRDITVRQVLDAAAQQVGSRFAGRPDVESGVRMALGQSYLGLGDYARAEAEFGAVMRLDQIRAGAARLALAELYTQTDQLAKAREFAQPVAASSDPGLRLQARLALAWIDHQQGQQEAALQALDQLAPELAARYGADDPVTALFRQRRATALMNLGRFDQAIAACEEILQSERSRYGEAHVRTVIAERGLGAAYYMADKLDQALPVLEHAYRQSLAVLGPEHDQTLTSASDLAQVHQGRGEFAEAEKLLKETMSLRLRLNGESHKETRTVINNLGVLYGEMGRHEDELPLLIRAWEAEQREAGADNPDTLVSAHNIGRSYAQLGRYAEAEALQRRTVEAARRVFPPGQWTLGIMQYTWADSLAHLQRYDEAEALFEEAIQLLTTALGAEDQWTAKARRFRDEMRARRCAGGACAIDRR